ncbi:hypothetical protein ACFL6B_03205 [Thermodesulfobacteriota bacterium]
MIAIVVAVLGYFFLKGKLVEIDKNTFCPKKNPADITAVLIDRTDRLNAVQQASIRVRLNDLREEIPVGGSLELYSVGPIDKELLRPEFKMCNPGRGDEVNPLIGNQRIVERRWKEGFYKPLQRVFDNMLAPGTAAKSPIMESIQSIAVSTFSRRKLKNVEKRLVLVSDMLQHTNNISHYRGDLDFDKLRESDHYRHVRANLKDVKIIILYINRENTGNLQGRNHIEYWQKYFADQGAILVRVASIEG